MTAQPHRDPSSRSDTSLQFDDRPVEFWPTALIRSALETGDAAVSQAWLTLQGTFFGEVAGGRQQRLAALTLEPQGHGYRIASPVFDERWLALALGIILLCIAFLINGTVLALQGRSGAL